MTSSDHPSSREALRSGTGTSRLSGAGKEPRGSRRWLLAVATVLVGTFAALVLVELIARATGHQPRRPADRPEPPIHAPDPVLGWKPVPGHYRFGPYSPGADAVDVTIQPDGSRKTQAASSPARPEVLLVGCSFTMGWAVSDDQTWAWRLQELRPDVKVINRGVGGYGTLQSLLLLEQLIGRDGQRPARVLYGFIDHGWRNVAAPLWLLSLSFNQHTVATPYATVTADGRLERHPPLAYPSLPLHQYLASVALLEDAWLHWQANGRQKMSTKVTQALLRQMATLCRENGIDFSMVLLSVRQGTKVAYERFAKQENLDVIDCNRPQLGVDEVVPGEAHPNAAVHRAWGECIAAALAEPQRLGASGRHQHD